MVNDRVMTNENLTVEEKEPWEYHQLIVDKYIELLNALRKNIIDVSNMHFSSSHEIYQVVV